MKNTWRSPERALEVEVSDLTGVGATLTGRGADLAGGGACLTGSALGAGDGAGDEA